MTHLAVLLDGWDWIQLANIDRKATAHPGLVVTTLKNLPNNLAALKSGDKIHIVGHGDVNEFEQSAGTTPEGLADTIHASLKANVKIKIRVDTCYSGVEDQGTSAAKLIRDRLIAKGRSGGDIETSGTMGPSITGVDGKRIVVNPGVVDYAGAIQQTLEILHKTKINNAQVYVNQIDADSTSQEIKAKAALVKAQVAKFFEDFDKVLAEFQVPNQDMVIDHSGKAHKKTYA